MRCPPFLVSLARLDHLEEAVQLGFDLGPAGEGGVDHVDVERQRRHVALTHQLVAHHRAQARGLLAAPVVVEDRPVRLELAGLLDDLPGPVGRRRVLAVAGGELGPVGQVADRDRPDRAASSPCPRQRCSTSVTETAPYFCCMKPMQAGVPERGEAAPDHPETLRLDGADTVGDAFLELRLERFQEVHRLLGAAHQSQRQQHAAEALAGHRRRDMGHEIVDLEGDLGEAVGQAHRLLQAVVVQLLAGLLFQEGDQALVLVRASAPSPAA